MLARLLHGYRAAAAVPIKVVSKWVAVGLVTAKCSQTGGRLERYIHISLSLSVSLFFSFVHGE